MIVRLAALGLVLAATGCARSEPGNVVSPSNAADANAAAPAVAASDAAAGFERYAACAGTLTALSRLYGVMADQESGPARDDLTAKARARRNAAAAFHDYAVGKATAAGQTAADVDRVQRERDAHYAAAIDQQPLEQFAGTLAREADACKALADTAT